MPIYLLILVIHCTRIIELHVRSEQYNCIGLCLYQKTSVDSGKKKRKLVTAPQKNSGLESHPLKACAGGRFCGFDLDGAQ